VLAVTTPACTEAEGRGITVNYATRLFPISAVKSGSNER